MMDKTLIILATTALCMSTLCFANETKEAEKDSADTLMHSYTWNFSRTMEEEKEENPALDSSASLEHEKPIAPQEESFENKESLEIVYLNNLTEEDLYMFLAGVAPENIAICCEKGTTIFLKVDITGNVLSLNGGKKEDKPLMMAQTLYVRKVQGDFVFSNDLTSWKPATLFFSVDLKTAMNPDSNGNLQLEVSLDLNS
jgi:hypothetical protein